MHSTTLSSESLMKMYICSQTPVVSWPAREHIGVGAGTDQLHRAGRLHLKVQVHMPPLTRRNLQPFLLQTQPSVFTKTPKENPDKMIARTSKRRRSGRSLAGFLKMKAKKSAADFRCLGLTRTLNAKGATGRTRRCRACKRSWRCSCSRSASPQSS